MKAVVTCVVALSLAACGADGGAPARSKDGPLYVVHTRVAAADDELSYLVTAPSIDADSTFDLATAVELRATDVTLLGLAGSPYVYTGSCDEPLVTRWEVQADGSLAEGPALSFAGLGLADACFDANVGLFSAQRAYFVPFQSGEPEVVVWDPTAMEIVTTIPLGVKADGDLLPLVSLSTRADRLFATVSWQGSFDADWTQFGDHVHLIEIDPATNRIVSEVDDPRCNELSLSSTGSDGTLYYSPYSGNATIRSVLGPDHGVDPCALRIVPPDASFDEGFEVNLESLAGGRPAGGLELVSDDTAFIRVWHSELVDPIAADLSNWEDVTGQNGFMWWKWKLEAAEAEPIEAQTPGNYTYTLSVDGRRYVSHWSIDFKSTTLEELQPSGDIRPALRGQGQIFGVVHVR